MLSTSTFVCLNDVGGLAELGEARHLKNVSERLEELMHENEPAHVNAGRANIDHFPVKNCGGREAIKQNISRSSVAPVNNSRSGIGGLVCGEPSECLFNHWQT